MKHLGDFLLKEEAGSLFPSLNITVYSCKWTTVTRRTDENIARPSWRLFWYPEGNAGVKFMDSVYEGTPEKLIVIPPYTAIRHILYKPALHFYVHAMAGQPYDSLSGQVFDVKITPSLEYMLKEFKQEHNNLQQKRLMVSSFVANVLSCIPDDQWVTGPKDKRISRILTLIQNSCHENLDNTTLAKFAGLSRNAFTRLFKQQVGESPNSYVVNCRLKQACHQLLYTDLSIDEIAVASGFHDRNYMSRLFKQKLQTSPALYRRTAVLPENF